MADFKVGDVVKLNSGSPLMTVTAVGASSGVQSVWVSYFDDKGELKESVFPAQAVSTAKPKGF